MKEASNAQVVWITGVPGSGKTFIGDYLAYNYGSGGGSDDDGEDVWVHVEGDEELAVHPDSAASAGLQKSFFEYWFDGKAAPDELWHPYYGQVCDRVRDLLFPSSATSRAGGGEAKKTPKVVVTLSLYRSEVREWIRQRLMSITGDGVCFICLQLPESEYLERMLAKLDTFLEGTGMTREEFWESQKLEAKFGPCSQEAIEAFYLSPEGGGRYLQGLQPFSDEEIASGLCHNIDTSGKHRNVVPELVRILNLNQLAASESNDEAASTAAVARISQDRMEAYKKRRDEAKEQA